MRLIKPGKYHRDEREYECYNCGAVVELGYNDFVRGGVKNISDFSLGAHCPSCNDYQHFNLLPRQEECVPYGFCSQER